MNHGYLQAEKLGFHCLPVLKFCKQILFDEFDLDFDFYIGPRQKVLSLHSGLLSIQLLHQVCLGNLLVAMTILFQDLVCHSSLLQYEHLQYGRPAIRTFLTYVIKFRGYYAQTLSLSATICSSSVMYTLV